MTRDAVGTTDIIHAFQRSVELGPDEPAVTQGSETWTYAKLARHVDSISRQLNQDGIAPGDVVGVDIPRSPELIATLLAALHVGAPYLWLDRTTMESRRRLLLREAAARYFLPRMTQPEWPNEDVSGRGVRHADFMLNRPVSTESRSKDTRLAYIVFTSGSTGTPKGVLLTYAGLCSFVTAAVDGFKYSANDTVLQFASLSWDTHIEEIYPTLATGGHLILRTPEMTESYDAFIDACSRHAISVLNLPTSFWVQLVQETTSWPDTLRLVIVGGEPLPVHAVKEWRRQRTSARLFNTYGVSEATAVSLVADVTDTLLTGATAPLGVPIAGCDVQLVDDEMRPVADGEVGEIVISGPGVGLRYLNDSVLTRLKFLRTNKSTARMYRTGDLGRRLANGWIEFVGRRDLQLKVRGFRVEPGEIENRLREHQAVVDAVVLAVSSPHGHQRLWGFVQSKRPVHGDVLREFVAATLPDYMIPARIEILPRLPLAANGKVDRVALLTLAQQPSLNPNDASSTGVEEQLAKIWSDVLGVPVKSNDNFLQLGGDSIQALLIASRAQSLGLNIRQSDIWRSPRLRDLAQRATRSAPPPRDRRYQNGKSLSSADVGERGDSKHPLTLVQAGFLFEVRRSPKVPVYFDQDVWDVQGPLNVPAFETAWKLLGKRHAALRTSFHWDEDGAPYQRIDPDVAIRVRHLRLTGTRKQREAWFRKFLREDLNSPFDLSTPPLMRLTLLERSPEDYWFVWSAHRLILDGWSTSVLLDDLSEAYARSRRGKMTMPVAPDFREYVTWAEQQDFTASSSFWTHYLDGAHSTAPLPIASPAPIGAPSALRHQTVRRVIGNGDWQAITELARSLQVTPSAVIRGAWAFTLSLYTNCSDVVFGVTNSGRPADAPGATEMVGLFINSTPCRVRLSGSCTVQQFLRDLQTDSLQTAPHELVPLGQIQRAVGTPPGTTLFHSIVIFQNYPGGSSYNRSMSDVDLRHIRGFEQIHYPLSLTVVPSAPVRLDITYDPLYYCRTDMKVLSQQFVNALRGFVANPSQRLSEIGASEDPSIMVGPDPPATSMELVVDRVRAMAATSPDSIAILSQGRSISFAELELESMLLAKSLRVQGVMPGSLIGIALPRSAEAVVAMLACFKAGAGYVYLDLSLPTRRLLTITRIAAPSLILAHDTVAVRRLGNEAPTLDIASIDDARHSPLPSPDEPASPLTSESAAYVVFTSGTSGDPKGVKVNHRALANYVDGAIHVYRLSPSARVLQFASHGVDFSVSEIFPTLASGGTLVIADDRHRFSPESFWAAVADDEVSHLYLTASFWRTIASPIIAGRFPLPTSIQLLGIGGERADPDLVARWLRVVPSTVPLMNGYGPTETTVEAAVGQVDLPHCGRVTIGRPIPGARVYLLSDRLGMLQPVPVGIPGEVYIGGAGVAEGYVGNVDETRNRFQADPFSTYESGRMYRTGDLACIGLNGDLQFIGRLDRQVKLRGHRIELDEIELRLREHALVGLARVKLVEKASVGVLVAYVTRSAFAVDVDSMTLTEHIAEHLRSTLPEYMIPNSIQVIETLPEATDLNEDSPEVALATDHEQVELNDGAESYVACLWKDLLGLSTITRRDDFFSVGGDSLLAMRIASRIERDLGIAIPLDAFFSGELTVEVLASLLKGTKGSEGRSLP